MSERASSAGALKDVAPGVSARVSSPPTEMNAPMAGISKGCSALLSLESFRAAVATLPARIRQIAGLSSRPGDARAGGAAVAALRWCLGSSPDWQLALTRIGAPVPAGARFRRPAPEPPDAGATAGA